MLKKLKKAFGFRDEKSGNKLIINCEKLENRVALLENGILEEYSVERVEDDNIVGSIYKGLVKNVEPGLKAMFVDIGLEKNSFLHFWDAIPAALDSGLESIQRSKSSKKRKRITAKDIPSIYPAGSEVMIQVTKGAIGTKGPRVTTNISLAGRFLVLMPFNDQFGISRKIDDPKERARLRKIMQKLSVPDGMGIIMRTFAQGKKARYFVRDIGLLLEQWNQIAEKQEKSKAPTRLFEEPRLIERTVRDFLTDDVDEVICDSIEKVEEMKNLVDRISKRSKRRIHLYEGTEHVFDKHKIHPQIENAFYRQVWLPCGGYIVIDETEALIAIDVNTGRNKGAENVDKTLLQTNAEAAEEIARQLRLRNIGGIVVVDFIDMKSRRDQQQVFRVMKQCLQRDKAKTQVLPISPLGLMEMTRQRLNESLSESVYDLCSYCQGSGRVKTPTTISVELQRRLHTFLQKENVPHDLVIVVSPDVLKRLRRKDDSTLVDIERKYQSRLTFRSDPSYHREQILIADTKTGKAVKE